VCTSLSHRRSPYLLNTTRSSRQIAPVVQAAGGLMGWIQCSASKVGGFADNFTLADRDQIEGCAHWINWDLTPIF
jgi:hypothetical protein